MFQPPDIVTLACKQPVMPEQMELLYEKEQQIPGSVQTLIRRYRKNRQLSLDDTGMIAYHYRRKEPASNYLELSFCVAGEVYCTQSPTGCGHCDRSGMRTCHNKVDTLNLFHFRFPSRHLARFSGMPAVSTLAEDILRFRHPSSFAKIIPVCGRSALVLENLLNHAYTGGLENIHINAQAEMLLLYTLECMIGEQDVQGFHCKFLTNATDREKIIRAREILLEHIGEPITIRELSRKVAINECYLKKGFKELFGTTIFDFYQSQRMEHARYLLYDKGLSVTDVSLMLGYSSISHFSTAFKRYTGLKPCELLLRGS